MNSKILTSAATALLLGTTAYAQTTINNLKSGIDSTAAGSVFQESEIYRETVERENDEAFQQAVEEGGTSISIPDTPLEKIENDIEFKDGSNAFENDDLAPFPVTNEEVVSIEENSDPIITNIQQPTEAVVIEQPVSEPERKSVTPETNRYLEAMLGQMGALTQTAQPSQLFVSGYSAPIEDEEKNTDAVETNSTEIDEGSESSEPPIFLPGDIIFAETITSVNSDTQSPVLATVTTGDFKGARLVGGFTPNPSNTGLQVQFSSMTTEEGTVYPITGFAIDGKTAEANVKSGIDRRFMKRYGPIFAATFLNGYAQAKAQPEQQTVTVGDGGSVVQSQSTTEQAAYAGVAAATNAIASDIANTAVQGPLIKLAAGTGLAVVMVQPIQREVQ